MRLPVTLALFAAMVPASLASGIPGDGHDAVCDGRLASAFERRVEAGQRFRERYGMPTDRGYVEGVIRDPHNRPRGGSRGVVLTQAERRYLADRTIVQDHIYHVTEYVHRYARGVDGGVSIEDDFPAGAYVAARLTRDLEKHAAVLSKVPERVRVIGVRFTEREIHRQVARFTPRVFRALERDGIEVTTVADDIERNGVEADVISRRPDAAAVVERMFPAGPPVRATVVATRRYREVCVRARRYRAGKRRRAVRVTWTTDSGNHRLRVEVRENARVVRIAVLERAYNGPSLLLPDERSALVKLAAPLGRRRVLDAETGLRLRPILRGSHNQTRRTDAEGHSKRG